MTTHHEIAEKLNHAEERLRASVATAEQWHAEIVGRIRAECKEIGHVWRWREADIMTPCGMYCGVCGDAHADNG
jgi:hypothetical protein